MLDVLTSLSIVVAHWLHWLHTSRSHFDDNDKYDDAMMVALKKNKNTGFLFLRIIFKRIPAKKEE